MKNEPCHKIETLLQLQELIAAAPSKEDALRLFNSHAEVLLEQFGIQTPSPKGKMRIILEQGKGLFFPAGFDKRLPFLLREPCFQENLMEMAAMTIRRIEELPS